MVCLVGEQPVPNLLAVRHFQPKEVVLAFTNRVKPTVERLSRALKVGCEVHSLPVSEYDLDVTQSALEAFAAARGWKADEIVFNLTGGTKLMALAAHRLAETWRCPFIYVESEEHPDGQAHRYEFVPAGKLRRTSERIRPGLLSLDDYFKVHLGTAPLKNRFDPGLGGLFEQAVMEALRPAVDEVQPGIQHLGTLDFDLSFRIGNQVGVAELKLTEKAELNIGGFAQLSLRTHREMLGTYTRRFLIVSAAGISPNLSDLAEALDMALIQLPGFWAAKALTTDNREHLVEKVRLAFARRR